MRSNRPKPGDFDVTRILAGKKQNYMDAYALHNLVSSVYGAPTEPPSAARPATAFAAPAPRPGAADAPSTATATSAARGAPAKRPAPKVKHPSILQQRPRQNGRPQSAGSTRQGKSSGAGGRGQENRTLISSMQKQMQENHNLINNGNNLSNIFRSSGNANSVASHMVQEANDGVFCPSHEKFHTIFFHGYHLVSEIFLTPFKIPP